MRVFLLTSLTLLLLGSQAAFAKPLLLWVEEGTPAAYEAAKAAVAADGGHVRHAYPPHFLAGDFEWQQLQALPEGVNWLNPQQARVPLQAKLPSAARRFGSAWARMAGQAATSPELLQEPPAPPVDDYMLIDDASLQSPEKATPYPISEMYGTSLYLMGSVNVSVITPESNEASPNIETWSEERLLQVYSEIMIGLDWWAAREPDAPLTFLYNYEEQVSVPVEPILNSTWGNWVYPVLEALGYAQSLYGLLDCINDRRSSTATDWSFIIFVVDSLKDDDGSFPNGKFAYTSGWPASNGLFLTMTYDNGNYGIGNMDAVCAHETGHIFGAQDEYMGCICTSTSGYLNYENQNCIEGCLIAEPSIMRTYIIDAFAAGDVDIYSRGQVGWQDADADRVLDIVDTCPLMTVAPPSYYHADHQIHFALSGSSVVQPMPSLQTGTTATYWPTCTINTIAGAAYRINGGEWLSATPTDGAFDGPEEDFQIAFSVSDQEFSTLEIRTINSVGNYSDTTSIQLPVITDVEAGETPDAGLLMTAYPNPFNPTATIRYWLPREGRVRLGIYDLAGRLVRELEEGVLRPAGAHQVLWDGRGRTGGAVASGTYFCRLGSEGHSATTRLALIR